MQRWMRIAAVTAGLVVAGGVFGTISGTIVLLGWMVGMEGFSSVSDNLGFLLFLGVIFGGGLGAVLGPLAAWMLMRHVPLWLAVGGTTFGTCASGGLALLVTGDPGFAVMLGIAGFLLSAAAVNNGSTGDEQRLPGN
jgi:hypothetical protein